MNKERYILNIGSGMWQMPFMQACSDLGYGLIAVDVDPGAAGFKLADHVLVMSAHEPEPIYQEIIDRKISINSIEGVLTTASRGCITTAAILAERLNAPGPGLPLESTDILVDRHKFRDFLVSHDFPVPAFEIVTNPHEVPGLNLPVVVKSTTNTSGSDGITLVRNLSNLKSAVIRAQEAGHCSEVIIEEMIAGRDIGVLSMFHQGEPFFIAAVERQVIESPHFLPRSYLAPASLTASEAEIIGNEISRLGKTLGVHAGPFYAEYRLSYDGLTAYALEAEPTIPAHISFLVSESVGVNVNELVILSLLGKITSPPEIEPLGAAGCRMVYADSPGIISAFDPPEMDADSLILRKKTGDRVLNKSAADICGVLYASGKTGDAVNDRLNELEDQFVIDTKK